MVVYALASCNIAVVVVGKRRERVSLGSAVEWCYCWSFGIPGDGLETFIELACLDLFSNSI